VLPGTGSFAQFAEFGSNNTVVVGGPFLVRTASLQGKTLQLTGDTDAANPLVIYGLGSDTTVTWNGESVKVTVDNLGALSGTLSGPSSSATSYKPPVLSTWKYKDSLPEITSTFDDSRWTTANKTTSFLAFPKYPQSNPELLGEQDYGFQIGNVLFRGHFNATGNETAVELSVNGGPAFAASVWLNSAFLGSLTSWNSTDSDVKNGTFTFPQSALVAGKDNIITVLKDNMGINQASGTNGVKQARGIVGYRLVGGSKLYVFQLLLMNVTYEALSQHGLEGSGQSRW
jgi:hypothetical protein